jgi:hypothetical protein
MKKNSSFLRNAFDLVLLALVSAASIGAAQAADKIRYEDIPQHIASFGTVLYHRGFTVVTTDGKKYESRKLLLEADHVELFLGDRPGEKVPSEQVARIEIRQAGRYFHYVDDGATFPVGIARFSCGAPGEDWLCDAIVTALLSPAWAYTAVTAPLYLVADAVAFFLPAKVFEIVH